MKSCSQCSNRWLGSRAYPNHVQWHCRIGKKIVVIGKYGSDDDLQKHKVCKEFKV